MKRDVHRKGAPRGGWFVVLASIVAWPFEAGAVVGGGPTDSGYPAVGVLFERAAGATIVVCSATLIAPRVALTAAHCVANQGNVPYMFTVQPDVVTATNVVEMTRAFVHPAFDAHAASSMNDSALVELRAPLEGVSVASWRGGELAHPVRVGMPLTLVGYGLTRPDGALPVPKNVADSLVTSVTEHELVVGARGAPQSCVGDSGGPSVVRDPDGAMRLIGVVSRSANPSRECVDGSIHTRVRAYDDWIAATLDVVEKDESLHRPVSAVATPPVDARLGRWIAAAALLVVAWATWRAAKSWRALPRRRDGSGPPERARLARRDDG